MDLLVNKTKSVAIIKCRHKALNTLVFLFFLYIFNLNMLWKFTETGELYGVIFYVNTFSFFINEDTNRILYACWAQQTQICIYNIYTVLSNVLLTIRCKLFSMYTICTKCVYIGQNVSIVVKEIFGCQCYFMQLTKDVTKRFCTMCFVYLIENYKVNFYS